MLPIALMRHNVCCYSSLLRVIFVAPGFTNYTHAQLVQSLINGVTLTILGVSLFIGTDQCTDTQVVTAALLSAFASGVLSLFGRVFFKVAPILLEK